jgi:hypothetical protein
VGTTNSKPPGPMIMIDQSEILSRSQVQFITLFFFWRCTSVLHHLPATASCTNLVQKNQFPQLNRHISAFSLYILLSGVTYWAPVDNGSLKEYGSLKDQTAVFWFWYKLWVPGFWKLSEFLKIQFWGFEDYQRKVGKEAATNTGSIIRPSPSFEGKLGTYFETC